MENMGNLNTAQEGKSRKLFDIYLQLNPDEKNLVAAMRSIISRPTEPLWKAV